MVEDRARRLTGEGRTVPARVVDNVYEAQLGVPSGTRIRVQTARPDGCERTVAPELLARVATLQRAPEQGFRMPQAALDVLSEWKWQLDAIVEDGARFWGGGDGFEFWAVPVVKPGSPDCTPARHVCIDAITPGVTRQRPVVVYWRPRLTREAEATAVAEAVGADDLVRIEEPARTPRPVLDTDAPVVLVAGSG